MRYGKLVDGVLEYAEIKHGALVVDGKLVFTTDYAAYGYYPVEYVYEDGTDELVDGVIKHYMGKQEPYVPTYSELVEQYIREHGYPTYGAELAVLNNYATDPTTYADAFAAYQHTRNEAKAWAETQPHRAEEGE